MGGSVESLLGGAERAWVGAEVQLGVLPGRDLRVKVLILRLSVPVAW